MRPMLRPVLLSGLMTCTLFSSIHSQQALAVEETYVAKVQRVLLTSTEDWGGCMALLSVSPDAVLPECGPNWLSFSCTGEFADPTRANQMVDQAQLALTNNTYVQVYFTDQKKHNGYCVATRIDLSNVK